MFFLTQYIEIIKNQFALYQQSNGPSENGGSDTQDENLSLDQIDKELSDLAKATEFPRGQLRILLSRVERALEGMSEEEKNEDKIEIDRIIGRIEFLRNELGEMRDEAQSIADTISSEVDEAHVGSQEEQNDHIIRHGVHKLSEDIRGISEKKDGDFELFLSEIAEREGISKETLEVILRDRFDYSDVADEGEESNLAQELLASPEEAEGEILELINKWKEENIEVTGEQALSPENIQRTLEFTASRGSPDSIGDTLQVLQANNPDKPKNLLEVILGKIFMALFGIDIHAGEDGIMNTFGGTRESINGMLTQGGQMNELGSLSEFYESGGKGPEAINGNDVGMPSFGTYQLRADSLKQFADQNGIVGDHTITFIKGNETEFAKNWITKVEELGVDEFKKREHEFIKKTHYDVTVGNLGRDISNASMVLKNVIWSTSVQHGPNTSIIKEAFALHSNIKLGERDAEEGLIKDIYRLRGEKFEGGRGRYEQEQRMALSQLRILPGRLVDVPVGDIRSVQKEVVRNPDGSVRMTYCARTARLNAERFGIQVPQLESAKALENHYRDSGNLSSSQSVEGNVFQIFSGSNRFPQYGHVATGFVRDGQAFVLDPYLPATGTWTHNVIPLQTYLGYLQRSGRGFNGIVNIG